MRKVVDCFKFCHELDRLELRLRILNDIVDYFVITEAPFTHSGHPKPLYFEENKTRFRPWLDRIRNVVVEDMPLETADNYERDRHQLDCVFRGCPPLQSSDVLIVGDMDEIPNPQAIKAYTSDMGVVGLQCYNSIFYLNCENYQTPWYNPKLVPFGIAKRVTPSGIRDYNADTWGHFIRNGGWHFSYCGGIKDLRYKLNSFSHSQYICGKWLDDNFISWALKDPAHRGQELSGIPLRIRKIDSSFPDYVRAHQLDLKAKGLIWSP